MKPYVLFPGHVTSWNDRDSHFVGAVELARLYRVELADCEIRRYGDPRRHWPVKAGQIALRPDRHGHYEIPDPLP